MSEPPSPVAGTPSGAHRVEAVCDRFEAAWKQANAAVSRPRIADYLAGVPEGERAALVPELIALELDYRRQGRHAGEHEHHQHAQWQSQLRYP